MIHGTDKRYLISTNLFDICRVHYAFTPIKTSYKLEQEDTIVESLDIENYVEQNFSSWIFSCYNTQPEEESSLSDILSQFRNLWTNYIHTMQDNIDRVWYAYHVE